ncbi:MAG: DNA repair protein RecN [Gammaproteobacteria bacterium]|nr:DNA repair protein RecN [Gammaproteobacteria bacterium]
MLTHLHIQNFIIIDKLNLDFEAGLTVLTGETGAGKSIIIDALSLILGGRADSALIGPCADKCDLSACFDIETIPTAQAWLIEREYAAEGSECILRRVLHKDGKSRQFINGYNCTLQQLKEFLPFLINIHSQNQQQLLTKRSYQRDLIDSFNHETTLCDQTKIAYQQWSENQKEMERVSHLQNNTEVQQELLEYQIKEFEKEAIVAGEYELLDAEQRTLANAEQSIKNCQAALEQLSEIEKSSAQARLYQAQNHLQSLQYSDEKIAGVSDLINHSIIHLEEATNELKAYLNQLEVNPERLTIIERRLSRIHELARKYQTPAPQLHLVYTQLATQLSELTEANLHYETLEKKAHELRALYLEVAQKLHASREKAAHLLNKQISQQIQKLGMPGGQFNVLISLRDDISPHGIDDIEFLVATNPGQTLQPLTKVASGGEISRIALAIYVATAQKKTTPVLIFDEVDVGIGGSTAAIVGNLLKSLGKSAQVICITHLPQVAAYGDNHLRVQKETIKKQTETTIVELKGETRIKEIARMLGGITITEKTLAHAQELIDCE